MTTVSSAWKNLALAIAMGAGCSGGSTLESTPVCGDGVIAATEECDGLDIDGHVCSDFEFLSGEVTCTSDCRLDTSGCSLAGCGDGRADGDEACDGLDFNDQTCDGLGFGPGNLVCDDDCVVDTGSCGPLSCGNGVIEPGEICDGSDLNAASCESLGFAAGRLECTSSCELNTFLCFGSTADCGDGVAAGPESCDGGDLRGETCASQGLESGDLSCTGTCELDFSGCEAGAPECGDEHAQGDEECDGDDLRAMACEDFGFGDGTLNCIACRYAFFACGLLGEPVCGDNQAESTEVCDGADLRGQTCDSLFLGSGALGCAEDCRFYDISDCSDVPSCGDGVAEGFEVCDGFDLRGQDCDDLLLGFGTLWCQPECNAYDVSECDEAPVCGNNTAELLEVCDRNDLRDQSCSSLFLGEGVLACEPDCSGYVTTACTEAPVCGDGQRGGFEICDGDDLGLIGSCLGVGYGSGTIGCLPTCEALDLSACGAPFTCGLGGPVGLKQCDGDSLRGVTCELLGYDDGELACHANCSFDVTGCLL